MPEIAYDHYYRYDELTALLNAFVETYPDLLTLESIGQSYEGRDIRVITVTNQRTGPAEEKPAIWIDANIHASEVSGTTASLNLLQRLVTGYGQDDKITFVLDSRVVYICPRVNPDGAEWALADTPRIIRSSTRPYPYDEDPIDGLTNEDVDGDGRLLMMRIPDPNGQWKPHPEEPRLLIRRAPDEYGGLYYRVLREGLLDNYDGVTIQVQPPKEGLDLNRNFPNNWRHESEQKGAGPYPGSEPEVRAVMDFIGKHRNITICTAYHTYSGVLLRPYANKADQEMPAEDLWAYQEMGQKGTDLTGYPNVSIFHDFRYHPNQVLTGGADWIYEQMGVFYWAVEIWSPQRQAGIEEYKFIDWYRQHSDEDALKLLKWSDEKLGGKGYVDWYPFEHPQLGPVELGGWDVMHAWRNPPFEYLEKEIAPFADWFIWQALITPKLELFAVNVVKLAESTYHIQFAVHNTGWLPTYASKVAVSKQLVRGVVFEIDLPEGVTLESGKKRHIGEHPAGRAQTGASLTPWALSAVGNAADRLAVDWVVRAAKGTTLNLTATHERAGVVRAAARLE